MTPYERTKKWRQENPIKYLRIKRRYRKSRVFGNVPNRPYTLDEINIILARKINDTKIAKKLKRSVDAINTKRYKILKGFDNNMIIQQGTFIEGLGFVRSLPQQNTTNSTINPFDKSTKAQREFIDLKLRKDLRLSYKSLITICCKVTGREIKDIGGLNKMEANNVIVELNRMKGER